MPTSSDDAKSTGTPSSSDDLTAPATRLIALSVSFLSGVTVNVVSDDLGHRWTGVLWIVAALLIGGWMLSRGAPQSRAIVWFRWACCAGALSTAAASLVVPERFTAHLLIVAAAMGCAAALAAPAPVLATLSLGMLLVVSGVAFCAHGIDSDGAVGAVRITFGTGAAAAGIALVLGRVRMAGSIVTAIGAVSLAVAMLFLQLSGSALLLAMVFGALGLSGILVGTVLIKRPEHVQQVAHAAVRPIAGSLSLLYLALGALALHDGRILLAIADIAGASIVAVAVGRSFIRSGGDVSTALLALGPALLVDGVETAVRGQLLGGVAQAIGGTVALAVLATRLRGTGTALWRYAKASPNSVAEQ